MIARGHRAARRLLASLPAILIPLLPAAGVQPAVPEDSGEVGPPPSARAAAPGPVYIIPVEGPIEKALVYVVRRGLHEAYESSASAVILDMDTPGGTVDATREIIQLLLQSPVPTYTFVNPEAYSAGALIALATEHIYMKPGSVIGAARPVLMVPGGGSGGAPDEGYQEKIDSALAALARSVAQQRGHDPRVADAMVDIDKGLTINGEVLCAPGKILTLTNEEASRINAETGKPILSEGSFQDLDALIEHLRLAQAPRVYLRVTAAEQIARWIALFSPLLLAAGLLGIFLEIKTPGFGIFGIAGIACLLAFFFGHMIAGLAGMEDLLLFFVGVVLLAIELFVTPGFGLLGVLGIALITLSFLTAMIDRFPGTSPIPPFELWIMPIINLAGGLILAVGGAVALVQLLPESGPFRRLVLDERESTDAGFTTVSAAAGPAPGARGVTVTPLRPIGRAQFADAVFDVSSEGEMIDAGQPVEVVRIEGSHVYVARS